MVRIVKEAETLGRRSETLQNNRDTQKWDTKQGYKVDTKQGYKKRGHKNGWQYINIETSNGVVRANNVES